MKPETELCPCLKQPEFMDLSSIQGLEFRDTVCSFSSTYYDFIGVQKCNVKCNYFHKAKHKSK